ncbi:MAG: hypothetical protein OEX07_02540 [Gammaproteobacteria bacterium]|nr:hypothetical protein [Gammaproteobacteria bacterium]
MRSNIFLSIVVLGMFLLAGCAAQNKVITKAQLATLKVTIKAEDSSFTINSGEVFKPPFSSRTGDFALQNKNVNIIDLYDVAIEKYGAKKVKVSVEREGISSEFHGILLFSYVFDDGFGPGSRSYQIKIPKMYLDAARGGKVSVVYETYPRKGLKTGKSWVLWISDFPFEM